MHWTVFNTHHYHNHNIHNMLTNQSGMKKRQYDKGPDLSKNVNNKETKQVQSVVGTFFCYAQDIDSIMLPTLNSISNQQSQPTIETMNKFKQLMDYATI